MHCNFACLVFTHELHFCPTMPSPVTFSKRPVAMFDSMVGVTATFNYVSYAISLRDCWYNKCMHSLFLMTTRVMYAFSYTSGSAAIIDALQNLDYLGQETHTDDALNVARTQVFGQAGDRPAVLNVVVIISDGQPFPPSRRQPTVNQAADLQRIATSFAIGVTNEIDSGILRLLSSNPRELNRNYFTTPDFDELENNLQPLLTSVCQTSERK